MVDVGCLPPLGPTAMFMVHMIGFAIWTQQQLHYVCFQNKGSYKSVGHYGHSLRIRYCSTIIEAHFSRAELSINDYITYLKSVLDQSIHIIQAMMDICVNSGWLENTSTCMHLLQMIIHILRSVMNLRHCLPSSSVIATRRCFM